MKETNKIKQDEFQFLLLKAEAQLSDEELKEYYERLKEYTLDRRLQVTTKGALTFAPKLKNMVNRIAKGLTPIWQEAALRLFRIGRSISLMVRSYLLPPIKEY